MSKTILLEVSIYRSRIIPRIGYTFFGLYFLLYGLYFFSKEADNTFDNIFRISMVTVGVAYILYVNIAFSTKSRFAPRLIIDENEIYYKTSFFKSGSKIEWSSVKSIAFSPYRINLTLSKREVNISYYTHAEVSMDIKESLRVVAEQKNIEVIGG